MQQMKRIIYSALFLSIAIFTNIACQNQVDDAMEMYWERNSGIYRQYDSGDPTSAAAAIQKSITLDKSILKDENRKAYQYNVALAYMRLYCLHKYTNFDSSVDSKERFLKYLELYLEEDYNELLTAEYIKKFESAVYAIDTDNDVMWWSSLDESTATRLQERLRTED